ncbi:uncharacterized protein LOC126824929 [Patella vulgata]|uniref:uncharacterized protein LOC126824929 n=1 Tax=Patella vulgata TaxID=6465 RepID=UPI00217F78EF|nr:uncharacterized protein LOC126824929 [Patella vulgata]
MWIACVLLCLAVVNSGRSQSAGPARHMILPPSGSGDKEIGIIIVPEEGVRSVAYSTLAEEIQIGSNLPIWVGLMDTTGMTLSSTTFPILIAELLQQLSIQGMKTESADIFLAGHGTSGLLAAEFALSHPDLQSGVILMGSVLPVGQSVSTFPLPVLTLSGELDGVTRITNVANFYREFARDISQEPSFIHHSPLILLQGCNHALFSDGELPDEMLDRDIKSEVNDDDARMLVANYTVRFIGTVTAQPGYRNVSKTMFQSAYKTASSMLQPIVDILALTENEALGSDWVGIVQKWLSGLSPPDLKRISVESYVLEDATSIPPSLMDAGERTTIVTFSQIYRPSRTSEEIAARMIGPERISQQLGNTSIVEKYNCKDLNYASFLTAYHMASAMARERYDNYHKGIIFHDDLLMQSDAAWEQSQLLVETIEHELHVTAPNYQTPVSDVLGEWNGIFFCKLLPLDKALEWIYVDSLQIKNQNQGG